MENSSNRQDPNYLVLTITHDLSTGGFYYLEIFWPLRQILKIEGDSILGIKLRKCSLLFLLKKGTFHIAYCIRIQFL